MKTPPGSSPASSLSERLRRLVLASAIGAVVFLLLVQAPVSGSTLKSDEEVVFFPVAAFLDPGSGNWNIPVHGWVFEPEEGSVLRSILVEELLDWLELRYDSLDNEIFRSRARMFLVDNERGKTFTIRAAGTSHKTQPSGPNGHFRQIIELVGELPGELSSGDWLSFSIDTVQSGDRKFEGRAQIVPPAGYSVISDIDDTIKISNVLEKKELLENTFLRKFRPVPGMADAYRKWASQGAVIHYVSASPWQLYPAIQEFLSKERFPDGSFTLRNFRVKDRTFFNLFSSPEKSKAQAIEAILARYPDRKFILVGDSGEKDPEIYGALAGRYPEQVVRIYIRNVPGSNDTHERFEAVFDGLEAGTWTLFSDPGELENVVEIRDRR